MASRIKRRKPYKSVGSQIPGKGAPRTTKRKRKRKYTSGGGVRG